MMNPQVIIRLAILVAVVTVPAATQCDFDVRDGYIIDIHNSEKSGAIFLSDINSRTQEECQNACCNRDEDSLEDGTWARCNLAVFHSRNRGQKNAKNCFLVFCPSEDSCKLSHVRGFTASIVSHTPDQEPTEEEETTQSSSRLPEIDLTSPVSPEKETSSVKLAPSGEPTPRLTSPPAHSAPANTSKSQPDSPASLDPFSRNLDANQTMVANDTAASVNEPDSDEGYSEPKSTRTVIASNGALIAAVCFGILFLLAVLVVMSKHWYGAYQRRHYSKVDYLINGMYK